MSPLAVAAVAVFYAVCACALVVLARIASADPESGSEPRHLDTGGDEQVRDARPSPDWLRETHTPRHALLGAVRA
ncbi:MAG: hypothetical protein ACRDQ7_15710 [Haloechinothrix sp.]